MARQYQLDERLRGVVDQILLELQQQSLSGLQLLDVAREIEKVGLVRLADERLEEELIRREAMPKRGGHKAQGK